MKMEKKVLKENQIDQDIKNSGKIEITFTKYAIRCEGKTLKLSISKKMQEKFKVKSLNFLNTQKIKKASKFFRNKNDKDKKRERQ